MKNALAKSIAAFLFSLVLAVNAAAQENCDLTSKTAPLLLNLQIGISPEQTQAIFGRELKIKIKKRGERTFFQNYVKKPASGSLTGIRALYLRFFDRKLYQIEVFYEPRLNLKTLEDTIGALSLQLNLPVSNWQIKYSRAEIICDEISLVTDYILNPRVELTDKAARAAVEKAREKDKK